MRNSLCWIQILHESQCTLIRSFVRCDEALAVWSNALQRSKAKYVKITPINLYLPERNCNSVTQFYYVVASCVSRDRLQATRLNDSAFDSRQGRGFSPLQDVQPGCWAHRASYSVEREADQSFPCIAGLRSAWSCTSTPPCVVMALVLHK